MIDMNRRQWGQRLAQSVSVMALGTLGCRPNSTEPVRLDDRADSILSENNASDEVPATPDVTAATLPTNSADSAVNASPPTIGRDELPTWGDGHDWLLVRGDRQATGTAWTVLPEKLQILWTYDCPEDIFTQTPILCQNRLYVGSGDRHLIALDATDGRVLWKSPTELGFTASPAVLPASGLDSLSSTVSTIPTTSNATSESDNRGEFLGESVLIAGDTAGVIRRYDPNDGRILWNFSTDGEIDSAPTFLRKVWLSELEEDATLVGSQDGYLYCIAVSDGKLLWKYQNPDQIRCFPTVVGGQIFVAGCDGALHQIDAVHGTLQRSTPLEAPTGNAPAILDSLLFIGTEGRKLFAVNWRTGEIVWKYPVKEDASFTSIRSSVAIRSDLGVVSTQSKMVYGFVPQSGEIVWKTSVRSRLEASPILCGDRVYLGGMDGRLYVLDVRTGDLIDDYVLGGRIAAAVAIADERLFIGNDNGQLICLG